MLKRKEYPLNAASIDLASEAIDSFLTEAKVSHEITVQNRLFAEEILLGWLVSAVFVSVILSVATPPIPGGGLAAYTMLFSRLGIPEDALAIVLSMDILFDFLRTAANMYNLPLALIDISASMGKLELSVLRENSPGK